jgi:hypothetical protein
MDDSIWYVAYGSNMAAARLRCYIEVGTPIGAHRAYTGCRDQAMPIASRAVVIPGQVYFALESATWTGGMAFYDPDADGQTAARAWLITTQQFADVLSQEMGRPIGDEIDFARLTPGVRLSLGPGRYETVVHIGDLDGHAMVTFTCPWRMDEVETTVPHPAYLRMLTSGLSEAHGWDELRAQAHFGQAP